MEVVLWGTRGSIAAPGPETARHGGNTSCVEVRAGPDAVVVLDAGTGIRALGQALDPVPPRIDVLLTHFHLDHVQGLPFFAPLFDPAVAVHVWGPASDPDDLREKLDRYISPPLFPVRLADLPAPVELHAVPDGPFEAGGCRVTGRLVRHPGATLGFRVEHEGVSLAYLPDHDPEIGAAPDRPVSWTSGREIAADVDLLIHDTHFTAEEYPEHEGWGHGTIDQAIRFAADVGARHLVAFHHHPGRSDEGIRLMVDRAVAAAQPSFPVTAAVEGDRFELERK
jgi:phosphoribosyl 1,2-cyclic phosphodiesterase